MQTWKPPSGRVPEEGLLREVRARLMLQGTDIKHWAMSHGLPPSSVRYAILYGAVGRRLRRIASIREKVLREVRGMSTPNLKGAA